MYRKLFTLLFFAANVFVVRAQAPMWEVYGQEFHGAVKEGPYLWMIANGGLTKYNTATQQIEAIYDQTNSPIDGELYEVIKGKNGKKWFYSGDNIFSFDGVNWQKIHLSQTYYSVVIDFNGDLWAGNGSIVYHYDGQSLDTLISIGGVNLQPTYMIGGDVKDSSIYFYGSNTIIKYKNGIASNIPIPYTNYTYVPRNFQNGKIFLTFNSPSTHQASFAVYSGGTWNKYLCPLDTIGGVSNNYECNGVVCDSTGLFYCYFAKPVPDTMFIVTFNGNIWNNYSPPLSGKSILWLENEMYLLDVDLKRTLYPGWNGLLYEPLLNNQWRTHNFHESTLSSCQSGNTGQFGSISAQDGTLYSVSNSRKILVTDLTHVSSVDSSAMNCIPSHIYYNTNLNFQAAIDTEKLFWCLTTDSLRNSYLVCPQTCQSYTVPDDSCNGIRLFMSNDGSMWIIYYKYNLNNFLTYKFSGGSFVPQPGLLSYQISPPGPVYFAGNYYLFASLGLTGGKFLRYNGATVDSISMNTFGYANGRALYTVANNKLYVVVTENGNNPDYHLMEYDGNTWTDYPLNNDIDESLGPITVTDTCVWMITAKWVYKFENGVFTKYPMYHHFDNHVSIYNLFSRADGKLWVMDPFGGFKIFNPNGVTNQYQQYGFNGYAFIDANHNNVFDGGEEPLPYQPISNGQAFTFSQSNGYYELNTSVDSGFVHIDVQGWHTAVYDSLLYNFRDTSARVLNIDFPCNIIPGIVDVAVNVEIDDCFLWGWDGSFYLQYTNFGTETIDTGAIHFVFDSALTFLDIYNYPDSGYVNLTDTSVDIIYTNLQPGEQRWASVEYDYSIFSIVPIGTPMRAWATIYPLADDTIPQNNISELVDTSCSSFDPNDKTASPAGIADTGQALTYKIRFQNTGNYMATRVVVSDTLDNNLDMTTLRVISASHSFEWSLNGRVLSFIFNSINLPDSNTNEAASHGFVKYSIVPLNNISNGQQINNTAHIYFDFNEPVVTNTVTNIFGTPLSVVEIKDDEFRALVYPNPFTYEVVIRMPNTETTFDLRVFETSGRMMYERKNNFYEAIVPRASLSSGVYLYEVRTANGKISRGKLVAQ